MNKKYIENVRVDFGLTKNDFLDLVKNGVGSNDSSKYICTVNAEFIMKAQKDKKFRDVVNNAYLSVPDGAGVLMAEKYLDSIKAISKDNPLYPIKYFIKGVQVGFKSMFKSDYLGERLPGSILVYDLCELSQKHGWNIFLLGGWEKDMLGKMKQESGNVAQKTANKLKQMYPNLRITGATSDFSHRKEDDESTVKYMKERMSKKGVDRVDLVLVAYAFGGQEKWMERNLQKIPANLGIGLGGTFDQIVGNQSSCPKLFVSLHLEWLYRLIKQPWRVKRVLTAFPYYPYRVFISSLKQ